MYKYLLSLFFTFLFLGFHSNTLAQSKQNVQRQKFVSEFVGAINVHKRDKIIEKIDPDYRYNYLKKKHKGNKKAFLAEFFSGTVRKNGEYTKVPLEKIMEARLLEITELQGNYARCKIVFSTTEGPIETILILSIRGKKQNKFAFQPENK